MPTIPFVTTLHDNRANAQSIVWSPLLLTDDGAPFDLAGAPRSIFVSARGTFGVGGSVAFQGSADGQAWANMIQVNNASAAFTSNLSFGMRGNPRFIRPLVTAGDGTTSLTVTAYITTSPPDS
jgi:hypothetical protein